MSHESIQQKLILYLDGELQESERNQVQAHLDQCAGCRQHLTSLSAIWQQTPARETPPPFLWTRVEARIQAAARPLSFPELAAQWFGVMVRPAVMVLTLIIGIMIGSYIGNIPSVVPETATAQSAVQENEAAVNAFYPENMGNVSPEMVDMAYMEADIASR